jgi:hypothetical protein
LKYDKTLASYLLKFIADDARHDIGCSARRVGHDDLDQAADIYPAPSAASALMEGRRAEFATKRNVRSPLLSRGRSLRDYGP